MTPRRILLLIGGLFAFGAVYALYARAFGWLDGLPPAGRDAAAGRAASIRPPPRPTSPTIERSKRRSGEHAPETESVNYPTQLEFRNGDTSLVLASRQPAEQPELRTASRSSPFSVAVFGKPQPEHLRQPGEAHEITTFHADKAVLEFDREIQTPADMNKAKLVRLELVSDPEQAIPDPLKRARDGPHHQQPAVGRPEPVPGDCKPSARCSTATRRPQHRVRITICGPDIWTDAPSRSWTGATCPAARNARPRPHRPPVTRVRNPTTVAAILAGSGSRRRPSPRWACGCTSTRTTAKGSASRARAAGKTQQEGLRRVQRRPPRRVARKGADEPWVEGGQGSLVGAGGKSGRVAGADRRCVDAVGGGLVRGCSRGTRARPRSAPGRDPRPVRLRRRKEPRPVRRAAAGRPEPAERRAGHEGSAAPGHAAAVQPGLEIEFNGPPTGNPTGRSKSRPATAAHRPLASPRFKQLHAWTYTPGRFLTVSSDADQLSPRTRSRPRAGGGTNDAHRLSALRGPTTERPDVPAAEEPGRPRHRTGAGRAGAGPTAPTRSAAIRRPFAGRAGSRLYDAAAKANTTHRDVADSRWCRPRSGSTTAT